MGNTYEEQIKQLNADVQAYDGEYLAIVEEQRELDERRQKVKETLESKISELVEVMNNNAHDTKETTAPGVPSQEDTANVRNG